MKRIAAAALALLAACASPGETRSLGECAVEYSPQTLSGIGLVVGLPGTGDGAECGITWRRAAAVQPPDVAAILLANRSIALVLVTVRWGDPVARVSALGDAVSIEGGTLLPCRVVEYGYTATAEGQVKVSTVPVSEYRQPKGVILLVMKDHTFEIADVLEGSRVLEPGCIEVPNSGGVLDRRIPWPKCGTRTVHFGPPGVCWSDDVVALPGTVEVPGGAFRIERPRLLSELVRNLDPRARVDLVRTLARRGMLDAVVMSR